VAYTTMIWIALCLPLMVLGLAIATMPIIWAMIHEHRYGSAEKPRLKPLEVVEQPSVRTLNAEMTVCTVCSSVVADLNSHKRAVHHRAA